MKLPWLTDPVTGEKSVTLTMGVLTILVCLVLLVLKRLDAAVAISVLGPVWGSYVGRRATDAWAAAKAAELAAAPPSSAKPLPLPPPPPGSER